MSILLNIPDYNEIINMGPTCWLNSEHINGYKEPQPEVDDEITEWKDISGSGNDFYHEVIDTFNPPKLINSNFYPNKKAVKFDASQKTTLKVRSSNTLWTNSYTLVFVIKHESGLYFFQNGFGGANDGNMAVGDRAVTYLTPAVECDLIRYYRTNFDILIVKRGVGVFEGVSVFGPSSFLRKSNYSTDISQAFNGGDGISFGGRRLSSEQYDFLSTGEVLDFITFDRVLNDSETARIQTYIKFKYNL